jgi:TPP-dependent pyruvate/acetoin dehydrogenase alpha subunit
VESSLADDNAANVTAMAALRDGADVRMSYHRDDFVCPISITGLVILLIIAPV